MKMRHFCPHLKEKLPLSRSLIDRSARLGQSIPMRRIFFAFLLTTCVLSSPAFFASALADDTPAQTVAYNKAKTPNEKATGGIAPIAPATASSAVSTSEAAQKDLPVLLDALKIIYDDKAQKVTAEGDVRLHYDTQIMKADRMVYDRKLDLVTAEGHVTLWQNTGDVMFAERVILSRDMKQGFIQQIGLLMSDNSRFVAVEGERTEGRFIRMNRALYTACDVCKEDPSKPPLWQVRADRIIHDNVRKDVYYRNATLEMGGVPIFFTPYLAHPDPTVDRRSGFLAPVLGSRNNLGFVSRNYYYFDIDPTRDATLEASYSAKRGLLLGGEWRQTTDQGKFKVDFSATNDAIEDDLSGTTGDKTLRGHLFAEGSYQFDENWVANMNIKRTTDDSYLDLWSYSSEDILTSTAALENYTERGHGIIEGLSFQDLRDGNTVAEPDVVRAAYTNQTPQRDWLGGRWNFGADSRLVSRSTGQDSARLSGDINWRREDVLPIGLVITNEAMARVDGYSARNLVTNSDEEATDARPFAQLQVTARMPMVKLVDSGQEFLEPIAQLSLAPNQDADDALPNEDSVGLEYDTTNLFGLNRYAGEDILDGGQRVAYGMRGGWSGNNGASVMAMVGQSYELSSPNYPTSSGLETHDSDYVGSFSGMIPDWLDAIYSVRIDNATYQPHEHDLRMLVGPTWLQGSVNYLMAEEAPQDTLLTENRQEVTFGGRWTFLPHWTISGSHRQDLTSDGGALNSNLNLTYSDECLTFSLMGRRDYVARSGLSSGDSIFFRLYFKNLGEFESPSLSPDAFGAAQ